jgi:antitoxin ParD1/3/4
MADRQTMNVSLTPAQEQFVRALVELGRYRSASEVLRQGLHLLEREEHLRLLERWLMNELTPDEKRQLPADVLAKTQSHLRAFVEEGFRSADAGWIDEATAKAEIRTHRRERIGST